MENGKLKLYWIRLIKKNIKQKYKKRTKNTRKELELIEIINVIERLDKAR